MPITAINTLKNWFVTQAKPLQAQFWAWMDSFWHKSELIPMVSVDGLIDFLNAIPTLPPITGSIAAPSGTIVLPAGRFYREIILKGTGIVSIGLTDGGTEKLDTAEITAVAGIPYTGYINAKADGATITLYITTQNDIDYEINRS